MQHIKTSELIYSLNRADIDLVSAQVLGRNLTRREAALVQESIGDYIDWYQAIENAIQKHKIN